MSKHSKILQQSKTQSEVITRRRKLFWLPGVIWELTSKSVRYGVKREGVGILKQYDVKYGSRFNRRLSFVVQDHTNYEENLSCN